MVLFSSDMSADTLVMMILEKIREIVTTCTSARHVDRELDLSMIALFEGLLRRERFAREISAITRVMIILLGVSWLVLLVED